MAEFFRTPKATIRLDEVDWGGVAVNRIPPLDHPRVLPAASATYLPGSHVIFGVVVNGHARAYPKRILAWHERQWKVTEEALVPVAGAGPALPRVAAFRAFWFGWYAQFPDTILVK